MTITLPPDIEGQLVEQALKQGTTPERLALDSHRTLFLPAAGEGQQAEETLFDFLSGYVGTINGTTEALSEDCGQRFTEGMMDKQRQGHL